MFVSYTALPEGNKTRTIGSLKTETLQTTLWLEHSQRRDKKSATEEDRWMDIGGTGGGETKAHKQKRSNLVLNTQCTRETYCRDEVNL